MVRQTFVHKPYRKREDVNFIGEVALYLLQTSDDWPNHYLRASFVDIFLQSYVINLKILLFSCVLRSATSRHNFN